MAQALRREWHRFDAAAVHGTGTLTDAPRVTLNNSSANPNVMAHSRDVFSVIKVASSSFDLVLQRLKAFDEPDDIWASDLVPAGKRVAYLVRSIVQSKAPSLVEEITTTDDGGLTMEYASRRTGRDVTFVLPSDGRVRYFVARGPGVRYAGIVLSDDALGQMALWTAQERPFPERGLEVGKGATRRRG